MLKTRRSSWVTRRVGRNEGGHLALPETRLAPWASFETKITPVMPGGLCATENRPACGVVVCSTGDRRWLCGHPILASIPNRKRDRLVPGRLGRGNHPAC